MRRPGRHQCLRNFWVLANVTYHLLDSNIGISKINKDHCRQQFQRLMKLQLENSQVTFPEMNDAGLPVDIDSGGSEMLEDCPSGPHAGHRQTAKTINGPTQKRMRTELRRKKLTGSHRNAVVECNTINDVLLRNEAAHHFQSYNKADRAM